MEEKSGIKMFLASSAGKIVVSAILYIAVWGVTYGLMSISGTLGSIVVVACAIVGWQALNRIQPSMFVWMSWVGWLIYFFIKFVLAALLGMFIAPYYISKKILEATKEY